MSENKGICIIAEITPDCELADVTSELIEKARELSQKLNDQEISVLLIGAPENLEAIKDKISKAGADSIWVAADEAFRNYSTELYAKAACDVITEKKPSIVLIGATTQGRDLAPRISSALNTGLTADCTALDINEKGQLAATRPTFGGNLMATILCKKFPQMASVRPKVMPPSSLSFEKKASEQEFFPDTSEIEKKVELLEFIKKISDSSIENAEIIVAGGKGLKSAENFQLIEDLAKALGGSIAASRGVVDAGWRDHQEQVGQTGKTVKPKIYIACGISGAIQHTVGMENSDVIIAVNKDPDAPIFSVATYGIVGDLFEILPALTQKINEYTKKSPL